MCADASLQDFIDVSERCLLAESLGSGADCWADLDAVIQLCLDEAATFGHLEITGLAGDAPSFSDVVLTLRGHQTNRTKVEKVARGTSDKTVCKRLVSNLNDFREMTNDKTKKN